MARFLDCSSRRSDPGLRLDRDQGGQSGLPLVIPCWPQLATAGTSRVSVTTGAIVGAQAKSAYESRAGCSNHPMVVVLDNATVDV